MVTPTHGSEEHGPVQQEGKPESKSELKDIVDQALSGGGERLQGSSAKRVAKKLLKAAHPKRLLSLLEEIIDRVRKKLLSGSEKSLESLGALKDAIKTLVKEQIDSIRKKGFLGWLGHHFVHSPTSELEPLIKKTQACFPPQEEAIEEGPLVFNKEAGTPPLSRPTINRPFEVAGSIIAWERATPLPTRGRALAIARKMGGLSEECGRLEGRKQNWVATVDVHNLEERKQIELTNCFRYGIITEKDEEERFGFLRFGVICDHTNEFTNLEELTGSPETCARKAKMIEARLTDEASSLTQRQKNTLERCCEELKHPENTAQKRKAVLSVQMLDYLAHQVKYNVSAINRDKNLFVVNTGFLREDLGRTFQHIEGQGWMHSEGNEIADMKYMFDQINGKKVIFGDKGIVPSIDKSGNIHLPRPDGVEANEVTITSGFVNISVQLHDERAVEWQKEKSCDGIARIKEMYEQNGLSDLRYGLQEAKGGQNFANVAEYMRAIEKIEHGKKLFDEWERRFTSGESSYDLAKEFCAACCLMGIPLSMGCMGNKDRTGVVASQTAARLLQVEEEIEATVQKEMAKIDKTNSTAHNRAKREAQKRAKSMSSCFWRFFHQGSVAKQIAQMNSGQRSLKVVIAPKRSYPPSVALVVQNNILAVSEWMMAKRA